MFHFVDPTYFFMHDTISNSPFCLLTFVNKGSRLSLRLGEKSLDLAHFRLFVNVDGNEKRSYMYWIKSIREGSLDRSYIPTTPIIYSSLQNRHIVSWNIYLVIFILKFNICFRHLCAQPINMDQIWCLMTILNLEWNCLAAILGLIIKWKLVWGKDTFTIGLNSFKIIFVLNRKISDPMWSDFHFLMLATEYFGVHIELLMFSDLDPGIPEKPKHFWWIKDFPNEQISIKIDVSISSC